MSHLSDKELDRLSREAAEQFDVEGSTSGWDALEKKLDMSMPADAPLKRRRGLWYWLTGSLLLIGLLSYFVFIKEEDNSSENSLQQSGSSDNVSRKVDHNKVFPKIFPVKLFKNQGNL